jgi:hypothetical protein
MERSEWQILLFGAILFFIYVDMRITKLEHRLLVKSQERFMPILGSVPQQQSNDNDNYVTQSREAYQQYVPTKSQQLALMESEAVPQIAGEGDLWKSSFDRPLWDQKASQDTLKFDMNQVQPFGVQDDMYPFTVGQ